MLTTETKLHGYDVAFPLPSGSGGFKSLFRAILLSTTDVDDAETASRIERLRHLNGGRRVGVILLLAGENAGGAFARLQLRCVRQARSQPQGTFVLGAIGKIAG